MQQRWIRSREKQITGGNECVKKSLTNSPDLLLKLQRAEAEDGGAHAGEDDDVDPKIVQSCAAQHDGALQFDVIGGGQRGADDVKDPGHRFARENESGEKDGGQDEDHAHLQGLNLVLRAGGDEQAETEQRKNVEQRGKEERVD